MPVALQARVHGLAASREQLALALAELAVGARREEGCLGFLAAASVEDADEFVVISRWRDDAALRAHYTLSPIKEERVSEAAGVNSAAGSFGLSFGLAFAGAIMLATLSITFTDKADASKVLPPADQQQVADAVEGDAEVMSNTQLESAVEGMARG